MRDKIIVYDLSTLPEGWTVENILRIYEDTGIIFHESKKEGSRSPVEVLSGIKDAMSKDWWKTGCYFDTTNLNSQPVYYRHYYNLGIMEYDSSGLLCKNKGTIRVSKDVIDFLNLHEVSLDSKGTKVYRYNNINYIDLGPATEVWSKDEIR